ncbi:MAG TPA: RNA polymerase sigma factor [Polyangiaceae bacterium]|nr:RNA polymerase sigma factor [Polyangiaceae bacterium]
MAENDPDLVALLRARDPRGFELSYARHRDAVYAFLLRLSGRQTVAEDLFQETWLRLARSGATLRPDSDLRAWLFTVARNAFRSFLRQQHPESAEAELGEIAALDSAEQGLELSELERALLALPLDERELLLLVGVEGFAQHELGRMLGIAAPALRQRVTRARARLGELLEHGPASAPRQRRMHER